MISKLYIRQIVHNNHIAKFVIIKLLLTVAFFSFAYLLAQTIVNWTYVIVHEEEDDYLQKYGGYMEDTDSQLPYVNKSVIPYTIKKTEELTLNSCPVEDWNQIETNEIPNNAIHKKWRAKNLGSWFYLYHTIPSIIGAYVYEDHIAITLFSQKHYGTTLYCRYYDCRKREILTPFEAVVFPEATVLCGRRAGAEYITLSDERDSEPLEKLVKLTRRDTPKHFFTVCLAPLYGDEAKYLQLVEFIEYHKLQGATFFHIYHINITEYDRLLLDDYVRRGEIELIQMHDNFWRADFMWHMVQINDCHHRSRTFSKWNAMLDIDERLEIRKETRFKTVGHYLDAIKDPSINYLMWKTQWIKKTEDDPPRYLNEENLMENLIFRKFKETSTKIGGTYLQPKCIIRPERIAMMFVHWPTLEYPGGKRIVVNERVGIIRHYRSNKKRILNYFGINRLNEYGPYFNTSLSEWIEDSLTKSIVSTIKWVYEVQKLPCSRQQIAYYRHGELNAPCFIEKVKAGNISETS